MQLQQPNIVYFVCHDLGRHLGIYDALVHSPHLDAFARSGTTFSQAYCNSPCCSPSRACAMTGRYAQSTGAIGLSHMGWSLPQSESTLTEYLQAGGYETAHAGLAHERLPGENAYEVEMEKEWDDWHAHRAVDHAIEYLQSRERSRPFYLNIGTQQVHDSAWKLADELYGGAVPAQDVHVPMQIPDTDASRHALGQFQASIRFLDTHFQRLLDALDANGYAENTIVVFTTDHGMAGLRSKGTLYDHGTETALMLRGPGIPEGQRSSDLIQNIDLLPTLMEACALPVPESVEGRSFWPLLQGETYQAHDAIFIERNFHGQSKGGGVPGYEDRYDPVRSIRTKDFHYLLHLKPEANRHQWHSFEIPEDYTSGGKGLHGAWPEFDRERGEEELYHVAVDPLENFDVSQRPEFRHIKAELKARLMDWMTERGDFALSGEEPVRLHAPGWGEFDQLK